jgi:mRNA-degrading endonuclease toxin of MazEF toxin-antitoxin module
MRTPNQGDIWLIPDIFNPENKLRPVVVVSTPEYFRCRGDVVVLPISTKIERAKCETDCVLHDWREAGLRKPSYVKCNPVTLKQNELSEYVGQLTNADLTEVLNRLRQVFGF